MTKVRLFGKELQDALQDAHERRMFKCAYGAYNDYKICPKCASILDPGEACSCVDPQPGVGSA